MTQKIILITYIENNPTSPDYKKKMVSHGVDVTTGQTIILPNEPLASFDRYFDPNLGEYMLK